MCMEQAEESKIVAKIIKAFPASKGNLYDEYNWCEMVIEVLDKVKNFYLDKSDTLLNDLMNDNIVDEKREIVFKADQKRSINMETLKENEELFNKLAFVKEADVVKIVGRPALKDLVKTTLNDDVKFERLLTCNITDIEAELGKKEANVFIDSKIVRNVTPIVVEKGKYPGDHYKFDSIDVLSEVYINEVGKTAPKAISRLKV